MSSKNKKKWNCTKLFITSTGTGCGCGKPKLSDIIQPDPKPKPKTTIKTNPHTTISQSSSNSIDYDNNNEEEDQITSTTFSINTDSLSPHDSKMVSPCPKIVGSVAVVKNSDDPFQDFRQSMLQMILEKEIYKQDDLHELLNCFLELNSPSHHDIIIQAFMEICNNGKSSPLLLQPQSSSPSKPS